MNDVATKGGPADLVEIYYAPSEVFARRRDGRFGLPLAVLVVATALLFFVSKDLIKPVMDAEWAAQAETMRESIQARSPQMTPEQLEETMQSARSMGERFALPMVTLYSLVGPLIAGLVLWVVSRFVGVKPTLRIATMIAVFAFFPMLIEYIVSAVQMLVLPEEAITSRYSLSLGPARFMGDASRLARAVVGHLDVFTVWMAALMGIGLRTVAGATRNQAIIAAAVMWLLGMLPTVMGAAR